VFTALVGITRTSEATLGQRSRRFVGVNLLARGGFLTDSFGGSSHDAGGEDGKKNGGDLGEVHFEGCSYSRNFEVGKF